MLDGEGRERNGARCQPAHSAAVRIARADCRYLELGGQPGCGSLADRPIPDSQHPV